MKRTLVKLLLLSALVVPGCSTTEKADAPPKHMKRVQFVEYDKTVRPMTTGLEVFVSPPARKHKVIALITCEGAYHEEVVMTKAIIYKARQLGADAVIQLGISNASTGGGTMYGASHGTRSVFRFDAI